VTHSLTLHGEIQVTHASHKEQMKKQKSKKKKKKKKKKKGKKKKNVFKGWSFDATYLYFGIWISCSGVLDLKQIV
jgi:hypothetical protein